MMQLFLQILMVVIMIIPLSLMAQTGANPSKISNTEITVQTPVKHKISASEFLRLPAEKQIHIRNNPNLYVLDDNLKVELQRPIRHRIIRAEYEMMPTLKKAYIDANPDKYIIVD